MRPVEVERIYYYPKDVFSKDVAIINWKASFFKGCGNPLSLYTPVNKPQKAR